MTAVDNYKYIIGVINNIGFKQLVMNDINAMCKLKRNN